MHRFNTLTLQFLKAQNSDIQIKGMAGERKFEAGCVQLWDKNLANEMGFSEELKKFNILMLKIPLNQERYKILLMIYFLIPTYKSPECTFYAVNDIFSRTVQRVKRFGVVRFSSCAA
jgi:hypothetical protein